MSDLRSPVQSYAVMATSTVSPTHIPPSLLADMVTVLREEVRRLEEELAAARSRNLELETRNAHLAARLLSETQVKRGRRT